MSFSEHWKFDVDSRIAKEIWEKVDSVLDNFSLIGNCKFSLFL